jgi:replicative DNA helicase
MENLEKKPIIDDLEEKSNNEILFEIKQMEADHEAIKLKMLKDYDTMVEIEKKFDKANQILINRLKQIRAWTVLEIAFIIILTIP